MLKTDAIQKTLISCFESGSYSVSGVPSEIRLASEFGVSRMTARKALLQLEELEHLKRLPNGRLVLADRWSDLSQAKILVLCPAWPNVPSGMHYQGLCKAAEFVKAQLRFVKFNHWDDPVILESLSCVTTSGATSNARSEPYAGAVIFPPPEPIPRMTQRKICSENLPIVMIDSDLSDLGLTSILSAPENSTQIIMQHLAQVSEGPIDCFNTQPIDGPVKMIFKQWESQLKQLNRTGQLINDPVKSYENAMPKALKLARTYFDGVGSQMPRAVMCTTDFVAMAFLHAVHERQLPIGTDLKVATINTSDGFSSYFNPSLTALEQSDCAQEFERCFQWMVLGESWDGEKLLQVESLKLFWGQSSGARK